MSADEDLKSRDHDPRIFNLGLRNFNLGKTGTQATPCSELTVFF